MIENKKLEELSLIGFFNFAACLVTIQAHNIMLRKQTAGSRETIAEAARGLYLEGGVKRFFSGFLPHSGRIISTGILASYGNMLGKEFSKKHDLGLVPTCVVSGGVAATLVNFSLPFEHRELARALNIPKSEQLGAVKNIVKIAPLGFCRIFIPWTGAAFVYDYSERNNLSEMERIALTIATTFTTGVLSNPFGLLLRQAYNNKDSVWDIFKKQITEQGISSLRRGAEFRGPQMVCWVGSTIAARKVYQTWQEKVALPTEQSIGRN